MTLVKRNRDEIANYDPFSALSLFDDFWPYPLTEERSFTPAMDVTETDKEYKIEIEAPGVTKDDISIEFEEGVLTISGEKKVTHEVEGKKSHRIERRYGAFTRSLRFSDAEGDNIGASYADGVLTVTIPKIEKAQPRKIAVE